MKRKTLANFGPHGRRIRVFTEPSRRLVRVRWYHHGNAKTKSWPDSKPNRAAAVEWARVFADEREHLGRSEPIALRELWTTYAEAEFPTLRPRTQQLYHERWRKWELFLGHDAPADETTVRDLIAFQKAQRDVGTAVNQIGETVKVVKLVYAWGHRHEILGRNRLTGFRFKRSKEEASHRPAEYRLEEFHQLLRQFNYQVSRWWRPWAVLMVLGHQGVRLRAALHLRWEDVDGDRLIWRAAFNKTGEEWSQPLREGTLSALLTARHWRVHDAYRGPWVFYSPQARKRKGREAPGVYGVQSFWTALRRAEDRAGIVHAPYRAAHGFRRMVAGEILERTGDPVMALRFIGDTDMKLIATYLKTRSDRLEAIARVLDTESGTTTEPHQTGTTQREGKSLV